ncbi:hypothetical protein [Desulfosporosinus sp.]|nr:hypothetical protein [Desulfosporosinus sp.]
MFRVKTANTITSFFRDLSDPFRNKKGPFLDGPFSGRATIYKIRG